MGLAERKVFGFPDLRTRQGVQMGEENEEEGSQYFITVSYTHLLKHSENERRHMPAAACVSFFDHCLRIIT